LSVDIERDGDFTEDGLSTCGEVGVEDETVTSTC
jgi:hypothetical protein